MTVPFVLFILVVWSFTCLFLTMRRKNELDFAKFLILFFLAFIGFSNHVASLNFALKVLNK